MMCCSTFHIYIWGLFGYYLRPNELSCSECSSIQYLDLRKLELNKMTPAVLIYCIFLAEHLEEFRKKVTFV